MTRPGIAGRLRAAARTIGIPAGALRSDLPELLGVPSTITPDLNAHWRRVLARSRATLAVLPPPTGPKIAVVTQMSKGYTNAGYSAVMAYALRLRGADPFIVFCDSWLDGCEFVSGKVMDTETFAALGPRPLCAACNGLARRLYATLGLPTYQLSSLAEPGGLRHAIDSANALPRDRYYDFAYKDLELGPLVEASVTRFFLTNQPPTSELDWAIAKRMLRGGVMAAEAALGLERTLQPDLYLLHWGTYVARGTVRLAALAAGKRCVVWSRGYGLEEVLMFGEGENALVSMSNETNGHWEDLRLTSEQDAQLEELLADRSNRNVDVQYIDPSGANNAPHLDLACLRLDPDRPIVTAYTNIGFETKAWYDTPLYPDGDSWILDTIRLFAGRPEQLVIRVHPNEAWLPGTNSRQTIDLVARDFPELPENVRIVPPESKLSSYELARVSAAVLLYGSLIGLELAAAGKPVIAAGRAAYWQKGFTYDVHTRADYESFVSKLGEIAKPDADRSRRARAFAYYFYFLRNVPFAQWNHDVHPGLWLKPWWKVFRSLDDLLPGRDPNLDAICDHILSGTVAHSQIPVRYLPSAAR
ncbi:MAG: hypothetical protein HY071_03585 [Chloroflexi bacterium]|nr:hypothetical protein [Chloroflexota bacterium]